MNVMTREKIKIAKILHNKTKENFSQKIFKQLNIFSFKFERNEYRKKINKLVFMKTKLDTKKYKIFMKNHCDQS
jgi:hypothetical protein